MYKVYFNNALSSQNPVEIFSKKLVFPKSKCLVQKNNIKFNNNPVSSKIKLQIKSVKSIDD